MTLLRVRSDCTLLLAIRSPITRMRHARNSESSPIRAAPIVHKPAPAAEVAASIIEILLALEGDDREILVSTYSFIGATRARLLFHHGTLVMRLVDASNAHAASTISISLMQHGSCSVASKPRAADVGAARD